MYLITDSNPDFFKPLSGKNGKIIERTLVSLYGATFGDDFAGDDVFDRNAVRDTISLVIQQIPWQNEEDALVSNDAQKATHVIRKLEECGWIEFVTDKALSKKVFFFTKNGKKASQFLYTLSEGDSHAVRQRNVRATKASLEEYARTKDPADLVDAIESSKHIVSDLMDNINDIREEKNNLILRAMENVNEAGEDFVAFFDKRFSSDIAMKFGDDSAIMHKLSILEVIHNLLRSSDFETMEQKLLRNFPQYRNKPNAIRNILYAIKNRLTSACDTKLPQLQKEISSYVLRGESILRKTTSLLVHRNRDMERMASLMKAMPEENRLNLIGRIGDSVSVPRLRVLNTSNIYMRGRTNRETEDSYIESPKVLSKEAYIQGVYEQRKAFMFSFTDEDRISYIKKYTLDTGRVSTASFEISNPKQLMAALFICDIAFKDSDAFTVTRTGRKTSNPFFKADELLIERKK